MKNTTEIIFCFLDDYDHLEHALTQAFKCSKSSLKKKINSSKHLKQKVVAKKEYCLDLNLVNNLMINPSYSYDPMEILYEDNNYLVINKLPGVHSHPLTYNETDNCLSFLRKKNLISPLQVNCSSYDRGLLYRLDNVTSGVLVLVKNEELLDLLRRQYHALVRKKTYLAIVQGRFESRLDLSHYFLPSEQKGKKIKVFNDKRDGAELGLCQAQLIEHDQKNNLSLLQVELITGLRHQIRAQLSYIGYPILGDEMYGGQKVERVFLHAYNYKIETTHGNLDVFAKNSPHFKSYFQLDR